MALIRRTSFSVPRQWHPAVAPTWPVELIPTHDLAQGIVGCYPLNDGTGRDYSPAQNNAILVGNPPAGNGPRGPFISTNASGSQYLTLVPNATITGSFTVALLAIPTNLSGLSLMLLSSRQPSDMSFDLQLATTGVHSDIGSGSSWITTSADSSCVLSNGVLCHIAMVVTPTGWVQYVNGASIGSGSFASSTPILCDGSHALRLGDLQNVASIDLAGGWSGMAIYNRAITASEIALLAAKPFAMLRPSVRRQYYGLASLFAVQATWGSPSEYLASEAVGASLPVGALAAMRRDTSTLVEGAALLHNESALTTEATGSLAPLSSIASETQGNFSLTMPGAVEHLATPQITVSELIETSVGMASVIALPVEWAASAAQVISNSALSLEWLATTSGNHFHALERTTRVIASEQASFEYGYGFSASWVIPLRGDQTSTYLLTASVARLVLMDVPNRLIEISGLPRIANFDLENQDMVALLPSKTPTDKLDYVLSFKTAIRRTPGDAIASASASFTSGDGELVLDNVSFNAEQVILWIEGGSVSSYTLACIVNTIQGRQFTRSATINVVASL